MRRRLAYWIAGPTQADAERSLAGAVEDLGYPLVESTVQPSDGGFAVSFVLDIADWNDPLLGRVERVLNSTACTVAVELSEGAKFADLYWKPCDRRDVMLSEVVRLDGPTRYGVIGHLLGEYRIYAGPYPDLPSEACVLEARPDLEGAVERVLNYIEHGPESGGHGICLDGLT